MLFTHLIQWDLMNAKHVVLLVPRKPSYNLSWTIRSVLSWPEVPITGAVACADQGSETLPVWNHVADFCSLIADILQEPNSCSRCRFPQTSAVDKCSFPCDGFFHRCD